MDDRVSMLIEGAIETASDSLWSPRYQMKVFGLRADEGAQQEMMLEKLDRLDEKSAELRRLILGPVPESDTVSRLAAADAEIAADQAFDKARKARVDPLWQ